MRWVGSVNITTKQGTVWNNKQFKTESVPKSQPKKINPL